MFTRGYFVIICNVFLLSIFSINNTVAKPKNLRCQSLFSNTAGNKKSINLGQDYTRHLSKWFIQKSLKDQEQIKLSGFLVPLNKQFKLLNMGQFSTKTLGRFNRSLTQILFKRLLAKEEKNTFGMAPLNFIRHNAFIKPTRFISNKWLNKSYEPSKVLSFLFYIYLLEQTRLAYSVDFLQNIIIKQAEKELQFLISYDYRYTHLEDLYQDFLFFKHTAIKAKAKKDSAQARQAAIAKFTFFSSLINKQNSYDLLFSYLLSDSFALNKDLKNNQSLKNLVSQLPDLFSELEPESEPKPASKLKLKPLNQPLLAQLIKKHIQQELIKQILYPEKTHFKKLSVKFVKEKNNLQSLAMYKQLNQLYKRKKISKKVFLKSMQKSIQQLACKPLCKY